VDLKCVGCGWISWDGQGATVGGTAGGGALIDADGWQPGGQWTCVNWNRPVRNPSPKQDALDTAVATWLEAQRD